MVGADVSTDAQAKVRRTFGFPLLTLRPRFQGWALITPPPSGHISHLIWRDEAAGDCGRDDSAGKERRAGWGEPKGERKV